MSTPQPLPKPGSPAMREVWVLARAAFDLPRAVIVVEGALDRKTLDDTLQKATKGSLGRVASLSRAEVVGRLADLFHRDEATATSLMRDLDKSAHKERHIVASIDEEHLEERLRTYRALDFRRERARLVWALLRDGREAHRKAAGWVLDEAFAAQAEKERLTEAGAATGAVNDELLNDLRQRVSGYENAILDQHKQLQREVGQKESVERERAELVARLGTREKALREEEQTRRDVITDVHKLREQVAILEAERKALDPDRVAAVVDDNVRLKERVRSLERAAFRANRVGELETELADVVKSHAADLAEAAAVSVPTLKHYFGDRTGVVSAALRLLGAQGTPWVETIKTPSSADLRVSLLDVATAFSRAWALFGVGRAVGASLALGMHDAVVGPGTVDGVLEPLVQALEARLAVHAAAGTMDLGDDELRLASLAFVSPLWWRCCINMSCRGRVVGPSIWITSSIDTSPVSCAPGPD